MAVRTKIEPISDWVSVVVDEDLSPEARQLAIADFARGELRDALQQNRRALGRETTYEQFVDGRAGAALESVRPNGGKIVFEFELFTEVLEWIQRTLIDRSPKRSGKYRESHLLFAGDTEIPFAKDAPQADEYSFLNPLPYSRRLEIGKTKSGRDFVVSVPNRIYERTAKDAMRRFGNIARITLSYRAVKGGAMFQIARIGPLQVKRNAKGRFVKGSHTRAGNQQERALRVPTIIVRPN